MATEHTFVFDRSFQAATDLSAKQFYIVSSSAAGVVDLCTASSGTITVVTRAYGVLQNNPTSGNSALVRRLGLSKCVASSSGSIAVGAYVACSTAGTLMTATSGCYVLGTAMTASSGVAGQLIELELVGPFLYPTATTT
jgi:hypothetical protein